MINNHVNSSIGFCLAILVSLGIRADLQGKLTPSSSSHPVQFINWTCLFSSWVVCTSSCQEAAFVT
eukprot:1160363-Pelagomonas_calceolata.AAC.2